MEYSVDISGHAFPGKMLDLEKQKDARTSCKVAFWLDCAVFFGVKMASPWQEQLNLLVCKQYLAMAL